MCLGIPGQVVALGDPNDDTATVLVSGVSRMISIALLPADSVSPGDWVLVHAGFALSTLDEQEARETLDILRELGDAFAQEASAPGTAPIGR